MTAPREANLFVDDDELHMLINPKMPKDRFRAALKALEDRHSDFPRIHALFRGRYWPAVRAWFDDENGIGKNGRSITAQDGPETFDAPARRQPRSKVQGRPAILGGTPGRPRH
jgi:hypothetical protein